MIYVLDACAMIAFLRRENGEQIVANAIADTSSVCYAHAVNLCEVYYDFLRAHGEHDADTATAELINLGVIEQDDMDAAFWKHIGKLKVAHRISLADCFVIALTLRLNATLLTSDHHEFDRLAATNVCTIQFIR